MSKTWKIIDSINWAESYFHQNNCSNPRIEIEWLLRSILNCSKLDIYLRLEEPITRSQIKVLKKWVKRRIKSEPLQYITRSCEFYGRKFEVTPEVLIPRPETEKLIEVAIETMQMIQSPEIIDVGTGSGCIASTLAIERPDSTVLGIDISIDAIKIAKKNKSLLSLDNVNFYLMDILKQVPFKIYDIMISNPPYVTKKEMKNLMNDVKNFEPHVALTDYKNGLTFYNRFAEIGKQILKPNYLQHEKLHQD